MEHITGEAAFMVAAASKAFFILMEPTRLMFLSAGCLMGLILGIVPGIGGIAGMTMLLPFTFAMDAYSAFALLLGLGATTATGDPIPAILFGVPGGAASAATVLDGFPMAKQGQAGRALSAAYMSSLLGGVFGAILMAVAIPILRPATLYLGSPEMLALSVFGLSMVAVLSGSAPLRGLTAACLGVIIALVGTDPQTGQERWTFDTLYLQDGLPLAPLLLGLFALPELCDLMINRTAISMDTSKETIYRGQWQGVKDCFNNIWLIVRCSWIGGGLGAIPGISAAVVDWLAYGHALRTEKGAALTFGKGDVRGVIASESSNNAKECGSLVPTVAFGIPGSAGMSILLGAFLIHGLVPGPDMLTKNLDVTYAMVWSVALANILGAGLCFAFSPQFAKVATLRYSLILPSVLGIIFIGAFGETRAWGDIYALLGAGAVGWIMKQAKWPRPPLVLGMILGDTVERYLFISIDRYELEWLGRPLVAIILAISLLGLLRPFLQDVRLHGGLRKMLTDFHPPRFSPAQLFTGFVLLVLAWLIAGALKLNDIARIVPLIVATLGALAAAASLFDDLCRRPRTSPDGESMAGAAEQAVAQKIHMDMSSETGHLAVGVIAWRAGIFFAYLLGFMTSMAVIGLIPTIGLFVLFFMRIEARERWSLVIPYAVVMVLFVYFVFDQFMALPWPRSYLGEWIPLLHVWIPSV